MPTVVPVAKLNNGCEMPLLGLGTWKSKPGDVGQAVKVAIETGYRHIDCAFVYQNEKEVGEALTEKLAGGEVKREDLFITSKLWNAFHSPELVESALQGSLDLLGLTYLDLYLIHWPITFEEGLGLFPKDENDKLIYKSVDHSMTWKALEACVEKGLVRSIGLSNFNSKQIRHILDNCSIRPTVNQVECHPYLNQKKLIEFCRENAIVVTAYSPLGSPDRPWAQAGEVGLLQDADICSIADKHGKSCAQVLIAYQIQRGVVVIPKTVTPSRVRENWEVFDFKLSEDDQKIIDGLNKDLRYCHVKWMEDSPDFPFNIDY